jgi:hypothetical protein
MIVVKLMGGLGNQMFQYALGRKLSISNKVPLKFDLTFLNDRTFKENFTYRDFELNKFNLEIEYANKEEINYFQKQNNLFNFYQYHFGLKKNNLYITEKNKFHNFEKLYNNLYLDGFWQSELYFKDIRIVLLKDFQFKNINNENEKILDKIMSTNSISVHIRRGDYVNNKIINNYHGTCPLEYYEESIKYFKERVIEPTFYFFSDDINWAKEAFGIQKNYVYIDINNNINNQLDMFLMSNCIYNIIANSSFSWWAAWLNQNSQKLTLAPKKWFEQNEPSNIIPENWIRI